MPKNNLQTIDHSDVIIKYSFESSLGAMENNRYQQKIKGDIILLDEWDNEIGTIGKISADKLLMSVAIDNGCGLLPVCDIEQYLMDIGQVVYDLKQDDYNPALSKVFHDSLIERTILILNHITFLPHFESSDIEKYVVKDLYNNFIQGAGLFVVILNPPKKHPDDKIEDQEWKLDRSGTKLIKNRKYRLSKVIRYYEKIGFKYIPEIAKDLVFLSPGIISRDFHKVTLD
ncbi:MAG: hypothetical protein ABIN89_31810 [Chitinophagaceae bacterium]